MSDDLFDARNYLNVGSYNQAIAEATSAACNSRKTEVVAEFEAQRTALLSRAQLGLGQHDLVNSQLQSATHPLLKSVHRWALFIAARRRGDREGIEHCLQDLVANAQTVSKDNIYASIFACAALLTVNQVGESLTLAKRWLAELPTPEKSPTSPYIELRVLVIEGLLRLNQVALARRELAVLEAFSGDAIMTTMGAAMVHLARAQREGEQEEWNSALAAVKDVSSQYGRSAWVLNLMGIIHLAQGDLKASEQCLLEALSIRSDDGTTLANLLAVSHHLGGDTHRYLTQATQPSSSYAETYAKVSNDFDAAVKEFASNNV